MINGNKDMISNEQIAGVIAKESQTEQFYTLALFDILGFSNYVNSNKTKIVLDLYNALLDIKQRHESYYSGEDSFQGIPVPVSISNDWKSNVYVANGFGYVCSKHFSDTIILYVNYNFSPPPFFLRTAYGEKYPLLFFQSGVPIYADFYRRHSIFLSFLETCMDFFCQATINGIALRGCISSGMAMMDSIKDIYLGEPLIEAARGEAEQNAIGFGYGKSFMNYHPVYNKYFMPYLAHVKKEKEDKNHLCPLMVDWPRYWRESERYSEYPIEKCIGKMNINNDYAKYYENTVRFAEFSLKNKDWADEIDYERVSNINDYYNAVSEWYMKL